MPIPDYQMLMLPLLKLVEDGQEHWIRALIKNLAEQFHLSDEEKRELLPSGQQPLFDNRVGWARTYLKKAGLIVSTKRGFIKITDRGFNVIKEEPRKIDSEYLEQFPEFLEFKSTKKKGQEIDELEQDNKNTPLELLEKGFETIRNNLSQDLLKTVKDSTPDFFERLVVDLLIAMGYGGTRKEAGETIGRIGDEGVDGIIKEDKLGLEVIYIQAKKWEGTVGRPEIQKFVGALHGKRAKKGIFITTSSFSQDAIDYALNIETKVILIDGDKLTQYMIDNNVGVSVISNYAIKQIDSDYFSGESST
jgi:restriction system protein